MSSGNKKILLILFVIFNVVLSAGIIGIVCWNNKKECNNECNTNSKCSTNSKCDTDTNSNTHSNNTSNSNKINDIISRWKSDQSSVNKCDGKCDSKSNGSNDNSNTKCDTSSGQLIPPDSSQYNNPIVYDSYSMINNDSDNNNNYNNQSISKYILMPFKWINNKFIDLFKSVSEWMYYIE